MFVLLGLSTWDSSDYSSDHVKESGDYADMCGFAYFVNSDGIVYYENVANYMDFEYYTGPYKLYERILPALSKFVKGEIEVNVLLCAYMKTFLDVSANLIETSAGLRTGIIEMLESVYDK